MPQGRHMPKVAQESKEDLRSAQTQIQSSCFQWSLMSVLVLCPPTRYLHSGSGCRSYRPVDIRLWNHVRLENMLTFYEAWRGGKRLQLHGYAGFEDGDGPDGPVGCAWQRLPDSCPAKIGCCLIWACRSCCVQLLVCFTGSV
jgi:hypothetical protein